jgi:putative two-component system response regulator
LRHATVEPVRGPEASDRTVVVVDDDPSIRDLLVRGLAPYFTVYALADNGECWDLLKTIPPPAAILLDVMTPRLDGFSLARMLKGDPALRSVPIVFLTARTSPADLAEGINSGARQYVTKPFKIAAVVEKIGRITSVKVPPANAPERAGRAPKRS